MQSSKVLFSLIYLKDADDNDGILDKELGPDGTDKFNLSNSSSA